MTSADHYLNIAALGDSERPPFLQFDKYYYKAHINLIKVYFEQVKALGEGSTEEWLKGLPVQANAQLADYTRFEKWELKGGLKKVNHRSPSKSSSVSEAMRVDEKPDGKSIDHIDLSNKRSAIQGQSGPISDSSDGRIGILNGNTASDGEPMPFIGDLVRKSELQLIQTCRTGSFLESICQSTDTYAVNCYTAPKPSGKEYP